MLISTHLSTPGLHSHTTCSLQGMEFEPDVEVPLSTLLDHLQDKQRARHDVKLYLAQKGVSEVLPGLEQQIGPAPFPIAEQRLTKSSIWLGPQVRAAGRHLAALKARC